MLQRSSGVVNLGTQPICERSDIRKDPGSQRRGRRADPDSPSAQSERCRKRVFIGTVIADRQRPPP